MSWRTRLGWLLIVAAGCLLVRELDLAGADATEMTALALKQFDGGDAAAENLRLAEASRNWQMFLVPLAVALGAVVLLWDDLAQLFAAKPHTPVPAGAAEERPGEGNAEAQ